MSNGGTVRGFNSSERLENHLIKEHCLPVESDEPEPEPAQIEVWLALLRPTGLPAFIPELVGTGRVAVRGKRRCCRPRQRGQQRSPSSWRAAEKELQM